MVLLDTYTDVLERELFRRIKERTETERYEASNVGYQINTSREFFDSLEDDSWTIHATDQDSELHELWTRVKQP